MSLHAHKNFFNQRKFLFVILYVIIIFFISYIIVFLLDTQEQSVNLQDIRYFFTSHETTLSSSIHWKTANDLDDIKKESGGKYLYLNAVLPELTQDKLYLRSFNGTAKISVAEKELFNNFSGDRLSGSSYISIALNQKMSGETIEILLYSPLSDDFDIAIVPDTEAVYSLSNLPFAFVYATILLLAVLVISLLLCLLTPKKEAHLPTYLLGSALLLCLVLFAFEYSSLFGDSHFLFNLKLLLYLLIPTLGIIEITCRLQAWNPLFEAILSINILYAICILCLGDHIFFFILLYSGVFLQLVNLLFVINMMSKHGKPINDMYCAACLSFWCVNLVLWAAIALQKVFWQPVSFFTAVALYCLISGIACYSENKSTPSQSEHHFPAFLKKRKESEFAREADSDTETVDNRRETKQDTMSFQSNSILVDSHAEMPDNSLSALSAFNDLIIKKIYGTSGHSLNVSEYSYIISFSMGMSQKTSNEISKAAALHDIGKICIPERILCKKGKLSEEEFNEIRKHIIYGYQLLSSDEDAFFKMAALVAKEHHEHIDGSGYIGLKGTEISIPAKIVAVADVFDALVSQRSYKQSWNFDEAVDYICEHDRDYFDKDVVEAFVRAREQIYHFYQLNALRQPAAHTGAEN